MPANVRQHYVPQFLLDQWAVNNGHLISYHRAYGKLQQQPRSPRAVGYQNDLYTTETAGGNVDRTLETEFMTDHIDTPASKAHRLLLTPRGVKALDDDAGGHWMQFLIAQQVRVPSQVSKNRLRAKDLLDDAVKESTEAQQHLKNNPHYYSDVFAGGFTGGIQSESHFERNRKGQWFVRQLDPRGEFSLLLSDEPLIRVGIFEDVPTWVLPIAPRAAFVFYKSKVHAQQIHNASDNTFAKWLNLKSVTRARRYVFAADRSHKAFIEKYLSSE